jgi:hypothetical protein
MGGEEQPQRTWWLWSGERDSHTVVSVVHWHHGDVRGSELEFYPLAWDFDRRGEVSEAAGLPSQLSPDGPPISAESFALLIESGAVTPLVPGSRQV